MIIETVGEVNGIPSLNPYCNGCTSMIFTRKNILVTKIKCLNPYCNGCTSMINGRQG